MSCSSASHELHDLDSVTLVKLGGGPCTPEDDVAVDLDGYPPTGQTQGFEQSLDRRPGLDFLVVAVDEQLHGSHG
jgi:hypothetical protein